MTQPTAPTHFDIVGSFLPPCYLEKARADVQAGEIPREDLTRIENQAIRNLVLRQKALGLSVLTDGAFRQDAGPEGFLLGFAGVERAAGTGCLRLTGRLSADGHPVVEHFRFLQALEDPYTTARPTIPAPAQCLIQLVLPANLPHTQQHYPHRDVLLDDLVQSYRRVIADLYAAGCRTLLLDDPTWSLLADPLAQPLLEVDADGLEALRAQCLAVNELALADKPSDLTVTTRIRRNGPTTRWTYGGHGAEQLFRRSRADAFHLSFDPARGDSFAPLQAIPEGKQVVLGLISTSTPLWEDQEPIAACIRRAARYVPLDRLSLSPQGGFSAHGRGVRLTEREQWARLAQAKEIAASVW
jgi:methionine synthase II (cobalamin-independent)